MSVRLQHQYKLGMTGTSGELTHLLGQEGEFLDINYAATTPVKPLLSSMKITAVWVKNNSSGTLYASECVLWKITAVGTEVGGKSGALGLGAGIVDPYCTSVADGAYFWLIVDGPAKVISDGVGLIAAGDQLMLSATAGRVLKIGVPATDTAARDQSSVMMIAIEAITNVNGTKGRALVHFR